jgi:tripartite tricarboxylate transporter TctB family protein
MQEPSEPQSRWHWLRELVVPTLMLTTVGLFVYDTLHLSVTAMLLPAALIVIIVAALIWTLASVFLRGKGDAPVEEVEDEARGPILNAKAWLVVALPAVLFTFLDIVGTFAALVLMVFGAQLVFDRRTPLRSLLIAIAVTAPTYVLFKYVLYARFPAGVLGIG